MHCNKNASSFVSKGKKPFQLAALFLSLCAAGSVQAAPSISIADLNTNDLNVITGQNFTNGELNVDEIYAERFTVPYPSHDGNAVINNVGGYFDKLVTVTDWAPNLSLNLHFSVNNQTPWAWSDYHFEFWDSTFTHRLGQNVVSANSDIFTNKQIDGMMVAFWAPNWQAIGQTGEYTLSIATDLSGDQTFGIRQIATVPEPETYAMLLVGLGVLGSRIYRRKN